MGSGTTAAVALKLGRDFIGFELNPDYVKIADERIEKVRHGLQLGLNLIT
jgi:DNA modification methylase